MAIRARNFGRLMRAAAMSARNFGPPFAPRRQARATFAARAPPDPQNMVLICDITATYLLVQRERAQWRYARATSAASCAPRRCARAIPAAQIGRAHV